MASVTLAKLTKIIDREVDLIVRDDIRAVSFLDCSIRTIPEAIEVVEKRVYAKYDIIDEPMVSVRYTASAIYVYIGGVALRKNMGELASKDKLYTIGNLRNTKLIKLKEQPNGVPEDKMGEDTDSV